MNITHKSLLSLAIMANIFTLCNADEKSKLYDLEAIANKATSENRYLTDNEQDTMIAKHLSDALDLYIKKAEQLDKQHDSCLDIGKIQSKTPQKNWNECFKLYAEYMATLTIAQNIEKELKDIENTIAQSKIQQ